MVLSMVLNLAPRPGPVQRLHLYVDFKCPRPRGEDATMYHPESRRVFQTSPRQPLLPLSRRASAQLRFKPTLAMIAARAARHRSLKGAQG